MVEVTFVQALYNKVSRIPVAFYDFQCFLINVLSGEILSDTAVVRIRKLCAVIFLVKEIINVDIVYISLYIFQIDIIFLAALLLFLVQIFLFFLFLFFGVIFVGFFEPLVSQDLRNCDALLRL